MNRMTLAISAAAIALAGSTAALAATHGGKHGPDANGDGTVTQAEMQAHGARMFDRMDSNNDGAINAADRTARQAERFARLDDNGDGEVTQAEMRTAHEARRAERQARMAERREKMADRAEERFAALDTDKSGGLSQAEMSAARGKRGGAETAREGRHGGGHHGMRGRGGMRGMGMMMLRAADADQDRSITRAEFDAALLTHFRQVDTDNSGTITAEERQAAHAKMRSARAERRGAREGATR